jgi:histidinol phosphatase-like enzyme (inositol monophosphatase family)
VKLTNATLLAAVADVARLAGVMALGHYRRELAVQTKGDGSPVTEVDREAERVAREWVARQFPGDAVLGEEYGLTAGSARRWFIDPIDGTRTFVRGVPLWGTMVAVAESDTILAGAIYCPVLDELVAAALGEGCFHNDTRCRVSGVAELAQATILATDDGFRYHPERAPRWAALASRAAVARTWGDCYGYVLVATGRAEVMVDDRLSPWDAAPLIPIITEAGGVYTDWRGGRGVAGGDGVATNALLAATVRELLGVAAP